MPTDAGSDVMCLLPLHHRHGFRPNFHCHEYMIKAAEALGRGRNADEAPCRDLIRRRTYHQLQNIYTVVLVYVL
jgi:hypothetical protein